MKEQNLYTIRVMNAQEIKDVRLKLGLSQKEFCYRYGLPIGTLRNWEQDRVAPDIAASLYLFQIDKSPVATAKNVKAWIKVCNS